MSSVSLTTRDPRARVKQLIPTRLLDRALLSVPALYRTRLVNYETNLDPARVDTLVSRLRDACEFDGDVIECGTSRGGSAAIMAGVLREAGRDKTIFACDSFAGFERGELLAERSAGLTDVPDDAFTSTSLGYVKRKLAALGLTDVVKPIAGYFEETLPSLDQRFCFVFIDCDLRESVAYCARELWPRVAPGGQMVVDDYAASDWGGAARAVHSFLDGKPAKMAAHGEQTGMYWFVKRT